jgi:hypothetical protein
MSSSARSIVRGEALRRVACLVVLAAAAPVFPQAQAQTQVQTQTEAQSKAQAKAPVAAASAVSFNELKWADLVPKDWDPMKEFKGLDLGLMRDGDPKATAMLRKMREVWDNAPVNATLEGQNIKLPGFVVPLEEVRGLTKEFLLVPYYGACIHSPPPPSNQTIHVVSKTGLKNVKMMDAIWVSGTLSTVRTDSYLGVASYQLQAARVEPYVEPPPKTK